MRFVTIDMETYYDQQYSLTKMSTEDYICDPRFEVILVGIKIDHGTTYWITGTKQQISDHLHSLNLEECAILCHNTMFDALILVHHFRIFAAMYCDTLALAQVLLKPFQRSISLHSCLESVDVGIKKGTEVQQMKGRTRQSLTRRELEVYASYCMNDVNGTFHLFRYLAAQFPRQELENIDATLRMYLEPTLVLDPNVLAENLALVRAKKAQVLAALPAGIERPDLMSNPKFADVLQRFGVEVPTKISPVTGQLSYAFAKTDTGWKELEDEWADDPIVSAILSARLSAKSTLEETRSVRLLDIAQKYRHFRIPIRYYAAHTGRDGGMESINAQNLPRIDKSKMRFGVRAPRGKAVNFVVLAADLKQIEARIVAWLAGQTSLVEAFRNHEDIYSDFATVAFGTETVAGRSAADIRRRFVGKTCILGLGFGMGEPKLRATLRKDGIKMDPAECQKLVSTYRSLYPRIPMLWRHFDSYMHIMASGAGRVKVGPVTLAEDSIILPNGMALVYHNLRQHQTQNGPGWVYSFAGETRTLWGGKITENVVQALARILVMDYMLAIKRSLHLLPALRQHDELDYVIPEDVAPEIAGHIRELIEKNPPTWAPDLPVEVEINYGPSLGDCK